MKAIYAELRSYLTGWRAYFRLSEKPHVFSDIDKWVRRRLRQVQLKQWKRGTTVYRKLRARGASERDAKGAATQARRWWKTSRHRALHTALPTSYFDHMGVPRLAG